jgi:hypothetical protein
MRYSLREAMDRATASELRDALAQAEAHFCECTDSESIRQLAAWRKCATKALAKKSAMARNRAFNRKREKGIILRKAVA